jgi:SAM-dependent methyltransferase
MNWKNRANYGQEMAALLTVLAVLSILTACTGAWIGRSAGFSAILYSISVLLAGLVLVGIWSSRIGKLRLRDQVFGNVHFNGDESVLDIGCGRGLLLVAAAKRLTTGKAIGADHWKETPEYRYTAQMVWKNAAIEGVGERMEVIDADAQSLPFNNDRFDLVMTSLMMHHVADRSRALKEMVRVLKPGGRLILADVGAHRFVNELKQAGISDLEIERAARLFFMPVWIIRGKKQ